MGMSRAEAEDFKSICKTIVKGLGDVSNNLGRRIGRLEAENKELRNLWAENEKACIELKVRLDTITHAIVSSAPPTNK